MIRRKRNRARGKERGVSIIEVLIAMIVLLVGITGSLALVALSVGGNGRNRQQSNSTAIAQMIAEKISSIPASQNTILTLSDCSGASQNISTAVGGAPLLASGDVDFSQAEVANYSMDYTVCGPTGGQSIYDVRWNIQAPTGDFKRVVVSAKMQGTGSGANATLYSRPVTIRTVVGQGT